MSDPTFLRKIAFETPLWATFPLPIKQAMLQHKTNLIYIYSKSSLQHFHDIVNMFQNEAVTFINQGPTRKAVPYNEATYGEDSKDINKSIYIKREVYDGLPEQEKKKIDQLNLLRSDGTDSYESAVQNILTKIDGGCSHLQSIFGIDISPSPGSQKTEELAQYLKDIRDLCHGVKTANDFDWAVLNANLHIFVEIVEELSLENYNWNAEKIVQNRKPSKHNNQALLKQLYRVRFTARCVQQSSDDHLMDKVMETFAMLPLPIHGGTQVVNAESVYPPEEPSRSPFPPSPYTDPEDSKSV